MSITDMIGMKSVLEWDGDFIKKMVTPYGTTEFGYGENYGSLPEGWNVEDNKPRMGRYVEARDGSGTERLEYLDGVFGGSAGAEATPQIDGVSFNGLSDKQTTYYWDRKAWGEHPGDYGKAKQIRWLKQLENGVHVLSGYKESEKEPLESRVWYRYKGQKYPYSDEGITVGGASVVARVVGGETGYGKLEYNEL